MKLLATTTLLTLLTTSALATAPVELHGRAADALMGALAEAGSYLDCGKGQCGTSAADVTCSKTKGEMPTSVCTLKMQNERGGMTERRIVATLATNLTNILIDAGIVGCGMESCEGTAATIECLSANDPNTGNSASHCSIEK